MFEMRDTLDLNIQRVPVPSGDLLCTGPDGPWYYYMVNGKVFFSAEKARKSIIILIEEEVR